MQGQGYGGQPSYPPTYGRNEDRRVITRSLVHDHRHDLLESGRERRQRTGESGGGKQDAAGVTMLSSGSAAYCSLYNVQVNQSMWR